MWKTFLAIAYKEFIHAIRDKNVIRSVFTTQLIQLMVFGFVDTTVKDLPTVVVDQDRSSHSRELMQRIEATHTLEIKYVTSSPAQARDDIRAGRASVGVVIPPDFHRERARGGMGHLLLLVDGSDSMVSIQAAATVEGLAARMNIQAQQELVDAPQVVPHTVLLFNPQGRAYFFMLPALIAVMLSLSYMNLTAVALAREREMGNLERLLMTPLNIPGFMLGKLAPYMCVGLVNGIIVLLCMRWFFGVPIRGSVVLLLVAVVLYMLTLLSLGLYLAADAKTMRELMPKTAWFMLPTFALSGYIFPLASVPKFLLPVAYMLPATHMIMIMRGVVLRGAHFSELLGPFAYLSLTPIVVLSVAIYRFKKSIAEG